jgi:NADH-quinone oxidoreductase subunit N
MKGMARPEESHLLVLLGTFGAMALVASSHFASLFLGFELLSIPLFALAGYTYKRTALEAALKYLIMAGVASAFLLFGMALFYADTGSMALSHLEGVLQGASLLQRPLPLIGMTLILVGLSFKVSLVPFHLWTPDVYQGSPAPVTVFLATVSKVAVMAMLLRYFYVLHAAAAPGFSVVLALLAGFSMLAGNLLALSQTNIKRLLSYSSIGHMGYVLIPVAAVSNFSIETMSYYLAAYTAMSLIAFGVVSRLSTA